MLWRAAPAIFVVFWAGGYSFAKLGLPYIEPFTMLAIRFGLAAVILVALLSVFRVAWPKSTRHWAVLIMSGLLIQSAYFGFGYQALKSGVNAGTMAILMALQPILVGAASFWLSPGERGGARLWVGLVLGFGGVVLVILSGDTLGPSPRFGLIMAMISLVSITSGTLFEKRFGEPTHPLVGSLVQYVVGFMSLLPIALVFENNEITWHPALVASLAYLVVGNSLIAITLFIGLVRRGNATRISALMYLVPPIALLIAWAVLGETLEPLAFVGFLLCVIGVREVNRATA